MPRVTFVHPDGTRITVEAQRGDSVMQTALAHDIDGILAECGGSMMCATCHCIVDPVWAEATGPRNPGEDEMLGSAAEPATDTSRLSCQVLLTDALDGLVVRLPGRQT